jgi:ATP-dependent RNA helicase RhlB
LIKNIFKTIHHRIKNLVTPENERSNREDTPKSQQKPSKGSNEKYETRSKKPPSNKRPRRPQKHRRPKTSHAPKRPSKQFSGSDPAKPDKAWDIEQFQVPLCEGKLRFHDLDLPAPLMHAIHDLGFQYCSPIQAEILPSILKGNDATGRAQTGTGKTAAFLIAIITRLLSHPKEKNRYQARPRTLILAPTRELAMQITEEAKALAKYTPLEILAVFGGMDYEKQRRKIREKPDIFVATPGRLIDFHKQRELNLIELEILVIDEADRMLDMGFIPDVRQIIHSTPPKSQRQTLLFSATLAPEVIRLSAKWTREPTHVEIEPDHVAVDTINQIVYIITADEKLALLHYIITQHKLQRVLVFCNRRDETRNLTESLQRYGVNCAMISGEIAQNKRIRTLEGFRSGKVNVLVATDVAGRGLHIEGISHVINYALPHDPEDYVHRIGRTGRAGATGTSISFACEDDSFYIPDIETFLGEKLKCIQPDESWLKLPPLPRKKAKTNQSRPQKHRRKPYKSKNRTSANSSKKDNPRYHKTQ